MRNRILNISTAFVASGLLGVSADAQSRLLLTEISRTPLPANVPIGGGALGEDGAFAIWRRDDSSILVVDDGGIRIVCSRSLERPVGVAFVGGDSVLEVVDASRSAIFRVHGGGDCSLLQPIPSILSIVSAQRADSGWVLAIIGEDGSQLHVLESGADSPLNEVSVPAPVMTVDWRVVSLTAHGSFVILAAFQSPFDWMCFSLEPDQPRTSRRCPAGARPAAGKGPFKDVEGWVALPVFPLDSGFLQVWADPKSDSRHLVLFDERGRMVRRTRINAAFGVLSTDPESRRLLAIRRTNQTELVLYKWEWVS